MSNDLCESGASCRAQLQLFNCVAVTPIAGQTEAYFRDDSLPLWVIVQVEGTLAERIQRNRVNIVWLAGLAPEKHGDASVISRDVVSQRWVERAVDVSFTAGCNRHTIDELVDHQ